MPIHEEDLISSTSRSVEAMIVEYNRVVDRIQTSKATTSKKKNIVTFPVKLYFILKLAPKYNLDHIISWQVHGRNFVIRNRNLFLHQIASRLFDSTKFASFQRQLNVYDFQIVPSKHKTDKGAYYHPKFIRGRLDLCQNVSRVRIGGERRRSSTSQSSSTAVPNFYGLPYCYDDDSSKFMAASDPIVTDTVPNTLQLSDGGIKSKPFQESLQGSNAGSSLQHLTWSMFDQPETEQTGKLANDTITLHGVLRQNVIQRVVNGSAPASHSGFSKINEMRVHPAPKVDWNSIYTEAMSINLDYSNGEDPSLSEINASSNIQDEMNQLLFFLKHPSTIALGDCEFQFNLDEEGDDFHGRTFHCVDDDEDHFESLF